MTVSADESNSPKLDIADIDKWTDEQVQAYNPDDFGEMLRGSGNEAGDDTANDPKPAEDSNGGVPSTVGAGESTPESVPDTGNPPEESQSSPEQGQQAEGSQEEAEVTPPTPTDEVVPTGNIYEDQIKELLKPVRAMGKEFTMDNVEQMRGLASKGLAYDSSQRKLGEYRRTSKFLESNGITEDKLPFLVDLMNHDTAAIQKLMSDAGVNPMDIQSKEGDPEYTPTKAVPSMEQVEVQTAITNFKVNVGNDDALRTITADWDDVSTKEFFSNPNAVDAISQHVQDGQFDRIQNEVIKRRALGMLNGMSSMQAYDAVGTHLFGSQEAEPLPNTPPQSNNANLNTPEIAGSAPINANVDVNQAASNGSASRTPQSSGRREMSTNEWDNLSDDKFTEQMMKQFGV